VIRVLFDGQVFSIHKRGGIAQVFYSVFQESRHFPAPDLSLRRGSLLSRYAQDKKASRFKTPIYISGNLKAKIALVINWFYLWFSPYQIVHSTYYFRGYLWRRPGTKHVVTLHDMIPEDFPELFPNGNPHFQKEAFLRDADRIVCVSNYTMSRLNFYFPELIHKATVIYLGVRIPQNIEFPVARCPTILYVGSREGYKDFNTLLRALPSVLDSNPDIQLLAVSDKDFSESERSLIATLGLTGKVTRKELSDSELQLAYQTCCLTVVTSKVEGFGLPVIEAMVLGCPVVASDIPVFREISENSFLPFRPGDAQDLALKIKAVLADPTSYEDLREKGREIAKQYSWSNVLKSLHSLYREM